MNYQPGETVYVIFNKRPKNYVTYGVEYPATYVKSDKNGIHRIAIVMPYDGEPDQIEEFWLYESRGDQISRERIITTTDRAYVALFKRLIYYYLRRI